MYLYPINIPIQKRLAYQTMRQFLLMILLLTVLFNCFSFKANSQSSKDLRVVIVRHGEKDVTGDNLNCKGFNRSIQLPKVIVSKFGIPSMIYVPAVNSGKSTTHSRMFQTASPLAIKYNLTVNSKYDVEDYDKLSESIEGQKGTILIVWEHNAIVDIVKAFGLKVKGLDWPEDDFDSIWILTSKNGNFVLTKDKENIKPVSSCQF